MTLTQIRRRLLQGAAPLVLSFIALSVAATPATAAATLNLAVSPDPIQGQQASITVSGTADASSIDDSIEVYLDSSGGCGVSSFSEGQRDSSTNVVDDFVSGPTYSDSASGILASTDPIEVCGYISTSPAATPDAFGAVSFTPRFPRVSLATTSSAKSNATGLFPLTLAGFSEVKGSLSVYLEPLGNVCSITAADEAATGGRRLLGGAPVGPGRFSDSIDVTSPYPVNVRLCAYITEPTQGSSGATPVTYAESELFMPRRPSSGVLGGRGVVTSSGQVGALRIDRSTAADVFAFAGTPDLIQPGRSTDGSNRPLLRIGYGCSSNGNECRTEYNINENTKHLSNFSTTSRRFHTAHGTTVGMSQSQAERREGKRAAPGCFSGIRFSRRGIFFYILTFGGRSVVHGNRTTLVRSHVGELYVVSARHDVIGC